VTIIRQNFHLLCSFEELPNRSLVEKRHAKDSEYVKSSAIKAKIMFYNSDKTICRYGRVNLDSDSIFSNPPKRFDVQMLLYPFKEQFDLPSVFIKHRNMFTFNSKAVGKIGECPLVFHRVINNTSEMTRIFFSCLLSRKSYRLVVENIVRKFKKVFTLNNFILKIPPFPYYEVGTDKIESKKPCKVKVSSIEDIVGIRLVRDLIHGIHVVNFGFSNMKKGWNLSNNIIERMYLDSSFCLAKTRPPKKIQTQIYSSGVKGVESTCDLKFFCNKLSLSNRYHFVSKFLKDLGIPVCICLGKIAARYYGLAESEMIRFRGMCGYYTDQFSKAFTTGQLPEHHDQQLVPATERLYIFVTLIFHNDTIKNSLWKKFNELTENIFSIVHNIRFYKSDTILRFQIDTLKI